MHKDIERSERVGHSRVGLLLGMVVLGMVGVCLMGCNAVSSDESALHLVDHGMRIAPLYDDYGWSEEKPLLVGSRVCGQPSCSSMFCPGPLEDSPEAEVLEGLSRRECFDEGAVSGAASFDDGCLVVEAEGPADWAFAPSDCAHRSLLEWDDGTYAFQFTGIDPSRVQARVDLVLERMLVEQAEQLGSEEAELIEPERWASTALDPRPEKLFILANQTIRLPVGLFDEEGNPVAFGVEQVHVRVEQLRPHPSAGPGYALAGPEASAPPLESFAVGIALAEDAEVRLDLVYTPADGPPVTFEGTKLVSVRAEDVEQVELQLFRLLPGSWVNGSLGARAVATATFGERVLGVPYTWEVLEGRFVLIEHEPSNEPVPAADPPPGSGWLQLHGDWATLEDRCLPEFERFGPRSAAFRASWEGHDDFKRHDWEEDDDGAFVEDDRATFVEDERCMGPDVWTYDAPPGPPAQPPQSDPPPIGAPAPTRPGPLGLMCDCAGVAGRPGWTGLGWAAMVGVLMTRRRAPGRRRRTSCGGSEQRS